MNDWPSESVDALRTLAARLKHDLGKYVSLQSRWLPPDADAEARREALVSDLLHTRRGPSGSESAVAVWTPFWAQLSGRAALDDGSRLDLSGDSDVSMLIELMNALHDVSKRLESRAASDAEVDRGLELAREVAMRASSLVKRTREES